MSLLRFEGETLNIGGMEITGTILIEYRVTDASFYHEHGKQEEIDVEFSPEGFIPDADLGIELRFSLVLRAIIDWMDKNERRIDAAYLKQT